MASIFKLNKEDEDTLAAQEQTWPLSMIDILIM